MTQFTSAYFREEAVRFHDLMGKRSFWRGETPARALLGFAFVYIRIEKPEPKDAILFETMLMEFERRQLLVDVGPFRELRKVGT